MDHSRKAEELFRSGCNCSQAVFTAFCDVTGMDEKTALKLSSSFGGGMGRLREVCGAYTGMFMVAGLLYGYSEIGNDILKGEHYALIQRLAGELREKYGSLLCRDLLGEEGKSSKPEPAKRTRDFYDKRPCAAIIRDAAAILDKLIEEKNNENSGSVR
jgi:C_GCAxxG_C_C family probable redox protein